MATLLPTILTVIGARPQFIKHAPLQLQLQLHFRTLTLHTGQHYDADMSAAFFEELAIPQPDYMLSLEPATGPARQTAAMMTGIEEVCAALRPDAVLLYGDTNSTLAGALVAVKMGIPTIHVEAGIRSHNRAMPEEVNRIIADRFADVLFCPVPEAVEHLRKEGIAHEGVHLSGDVMCDMLELLRPRISPPERGPYYFATIHRPYNTDDPSRLRRILDTLDRLRYPVIFPLHPRTRGRMLAMDADPEQYPNIRFSGPVGYLECISYQAGAECVITDSGGIQKEAYMLRKQCITLRSETEWNRTLEHGWNTLLFNDIERIVTAVEAEPGVWIPGLFGDGRAAAYISRTLRQRFG